MNEPPEEDTNLSALDAFVKASQAEGQGNISEAIRLYAQAYRLDANIDHHPLLPERLSQFNIEKHEEEIVYVDAELQGELFSRPDSHYWPCGLTTNIWHSIFLHLQPYPFTYECLSATCLPLYKLTRQDHAHARMQYIEQKRVRFDGVYVAKFTYFREGESQFTYQHPVHLVTYYRYLRFECSDTHGPLVLSLVTPAEPKKVLDILRDGSDDKQQKQVDNLQRGTWQFDAVTGDLSITLNSSLTYKIQGTIQNTPKNTLHRSNAIQIHSFAGYHQGQQMISFDVEQWPRYRFSRVKSYHLIQ